MKEKFTKHIWIWLGLGALLLRLLFSIFPPLGEWLYRTLVFPLVRVILDNTLGLLPISGFWVLLILLVLFLLKYFLKDRKPKPSIKKRITNGLSVIGFVVFWFLTLWGFHYPLSDYQELAGLEQSESPDLISFYRSTLVEAEINRDYIQGGAMSDSKLPDNTVKKIRAQVKDAISAAGLPAYTNVTCRETGSGFIRRLSIHGFYLPFSGEGMVDGSLTTIPRVFTIAHEMAHGYGITDEGEANFVAYIALKNTTEPSLNYIADFVLFRHLLMAISRAHPEEFHQLYQEIPDNILADIDLISRDVSKYEDFFPQLSAQVNNAYLKAQGVEKGIDSYDDLIMLAHSWNLNDRQIGNQKEK
ncbi:DUF3810 family protein [Halocola ammonii]